jgi:hypothetical protein
VSLGYGLSSTLRAFGNRLLLAWETSFKSSSLKFGNVFLAWEHEEWLYIYDIDIILRYQSESEIHVRLAGVIY